MKNSHSGALHNNSHLNGLYWRQWNDTKRFKLKKQPHKTHVKAAGKRVERYEKQMNELISLFFFFIFIPFECDIWWCTVFWCTLWCLQHHNHHQPFVDPYVNDVVWFLFEKYDKYDDYIAGAKEKWMHNERLTLLFFLSSFKRMRCNNNKIH